MDALRARGLPVWESCLPAGQLVIGTARTWFSRSSLQKEKQTLSEELLALKKENKLLKENNAAMSRRREHYECEIKRLNKVPGRPGCVRAPPGEAHMARAAGAPGPGHRGVSVTLHISPPGLGHEALGIRVPEKTPHGKPMRRKSGGESGRCLVGRATEQAGVGSSRLLVGQPQEAGCSQHHRQDSGVRLMR